MEKISHVLAHEKPAGETLVNFMQSITCGQLAGHTYGKSSGRPTATSSLPAMAAGTLDRCGKVIGSATTSMDPWSLRREGATTHSAEAIPKTSAFPRIPIPA